MLEDDLSAVDLLLLVLVDDDDSRLVVGHGLLNHLCGVGIEFAVLEELLDLGLDVVHIHVTHDDQGLVVGTIPLVVVVTQLLVGKVINHAHQADGQALAELGIGVQGFQLALEHAHLCALAQTPLLVDHTALLVDLLVGEQQTVAPVLEDEQARIDGTLARAGHVVDVIDGLGNAGVGIQVATEVHTQRAGVVDNALALAVEVLTAVEGHVLQEVGETTLALLLLNGAHALSDVEVHTVLGIIVVADVIGQSAVQFTDAHSIVHGDGRHFLCHHHVGAEYHEHQQQHRK